MKRPTYSKNVYRISTKALIILITLYKYNQNLTRVIIRASTIIFLAYPDL